MIRDAVPENDPLFGAIIAVQIFGEFLGFTPRCHILVTAGFHVLCGTRISSGDDTAMEHLSRSLIRASFSWERLQYLDQERTVVLEIRKTAREPMTSKNSPSHTSDH